MYMRNVIQFRPRFAAFLVLEWPEWHFDRTNAIIITAQPPHANATVGIYLFSMPHISNMHTATHRPTHTNLLYLQTLLERNIKTKSKYIIE